MKLEIFQSQNIMGNILPHAFLLGGGHGMANKSGGSEMHLGLWKNFLFITHPDRTAHQGRLRKTGDSEQISLCYPLTKQHIWGGSELTAEELVCPICTNLVAIHALSGCAANLLAYSFSPGEASSHIEVNWPCSASSLGRNSLKTAECCVWCRCFQSCLLVHKFPLGCGFHGKNRTMPFFNH